MIIFELIFLGIIAFLIITKMLSIMGNDYSNQKNYNKKDYNSSIFGRKFGVIDGTISKINKKNDLDNLDNLLVNSKKIDIIKQFQNIKIIYPSFDVEKFFGNSKKSFWLYYYIGYE
ncbi:MAG TPA: hypothetical protein QKA14_02735 [Candidatus Megaira endosymbiont of Hartmannula sinica]|nr:hypothetical protein [Candidatus Megaera endosymbiont of Hartmannula sinica]